MRKIRRKILFRKNAGRKPVEQITDRAKRYRAHHADVRPLAPKQCGFCGSTRNVVPHHVTGNEAAGAAADLMWACKSCNGKVGHVMRKAGLGKLTRQFNPVAQRSLAGIRRGTRRELMKEYGNAIKVMRGDFEGNVAAAMRTIQSTPREIRSAYTSRTWPIRRSIYGPSGRQMRLGFADVPF